MKTLLRTFLISTLTIWLLDRLVPGFLLGQDLQSLVFTSTALMFINLIVVPLLSIIFLPINILTIGLFKWVLAAGVLYLLTTFASLIQVSDWYYPGFYFQITQLSFLPPISIPAYQFTLWPNLVLLAVSYSLSLGFFGWLCSE